MKKRQEDFDSESITPAELSQRVVDILASAAVRLLTEGKKEAIGPPTSTTPTWNYDCLTLPKRGPIPFGQKLGKNGLEVNENEMVMIKRIQELAKEGWLSEKIAKLLNAEDHETKRAGKWTRTAVWRILKRLKEKGVTE